MTPEMQITVFKKIQRVYHLTAKNVLIGAGACCVSAGDQCCKCCLHSEGVFWEIFVI